MIFDFFHRAKDCPDCQQFSADMTKIDSALEELMTQLPVESATDATMKRIKSLNTVTQKQTFPIFQSIAAVLFLCVGLSNTAGMVGGIFGSGAASARNISPPHLYKKVENRGGKWKR